MSAVLAVQCRCTPAHETQYEVDGRKTPHEAVLDALAGVEGVDPAEVPTLYDSVDPDALNRLFERRSGEGGAEKFLCFAHAGWSVLVRSDGVVVVCDPEDTDESSPLFELTSE